MTIELVRKKYSEKILSKDLSTNDKKMLDLVGDLLKDDMCFLKIKIDLALSILIFLGYEKAETKEIYIKLINEAKEQLDGKYRLVDLNNK